MLSIVEVSASVELQYLLGIPICTHSSGPSESESSTFHEMLYTRSTLASSSTSAVISYERISSSTFASTDLTLLSDNDTINAVSTMAVFAKTSTRSFLMVFIYLSSFALFLLTLSGHLPVIFTE